MFIQIENYRLRDKSGGFLPSLRDAGCGCCATDAPATAENLKKAIEEAREWIDILENTTPVDADQYAPPAEE